MDWSGSGLPFFTIRTSLMLAESKPGQSAHASSHFRFLCTAGQRQQSAFSTRTWKAQPWDVGKQDLAQCLLHPTGDALCSRSHGVPVLWPPLPAWDQHPSGRSPQGSRTQRPPERTEEMDLFPQKRWTLTLLQGVQAGDNWERPPPVEYSTACPGCCASRRVKPQTLVTRESCQASVGGSGVVSREVTPRLTLRTRSEAQPTAGEPSVGRGVAWAVRAQGAGPGALGEGC